MKSPTFSIITVCKNAVNTIEKTVHSIINQSYPDIEYVIIDGESSDGTLELIKKYDSHITQVISEKDDGIYDAMNKGVHNMHGDFALFVNADDYLFNDTVISRVANAIKKTPPADVFFGDVIIYHKDTGKASLWNPRERDTLSMYIGAFPHQATFYQKDAFEKNGLFDSSFRIAGDYDWAVRGFVKNKLVFRKIDILISVFAKGGISTQESFQTINRCEKQRVIDTYFSDYDKIRYGVGKFLRKNKLL